MHAFRIFLLDQPWTNRNVGHGSHGMVLIACAGDSGDSGDYAEDFHSSAAVKWHHCTGGLDLPTACNRLQLSICEILWTCHFHAFPFISIHFHSFGCYINVLMFCPKIPGLFPSFLPNLQMDDILDDWDVFLPRLHLWKKTQNTLNATRKMVFLTVLLSTKNTKNTNNRGTRPFIPCISKRLEECQKIQKSKETSNKNPK